MELFYVFFLLVSSVSAFAFHDVFDESFAEFDSNSISKRISEGDKTSIVEAPFMAVIYADMSYVQFYPYSVGVIISSRWILTTAKFLVVQRGKIWTVLVGMDDVNHIAEKANSHGYKVVHHIVHHDYKLNEVYNDIALVKVNRDIVFNDRQQPISLLTQTELSDIQYRLNQNRMEMTIYNFGSNDTHSRSLLKRNTIYINTRVVDLSERLYVSAWQFLPTCFGDAGSPAIVEGKLAGLLSVEYACGQDYPNVFTSIIYYHEWITQNVIRNGE